MSYKKDLEKFRESQTTSAVDAVNFALGRGHLFLPSKDEMSQLLGMIKDEGIEIAAGSMTIAQDAAKKMKKKDLKIAIESLELSLTNGMITKQGLINLWAMAKDKAKRNMLLAAIVVGSVAVVAGGAFAIMKMLNRSDDEVSTLNNDSSDIDAYAEDIPRVDLGDAII